LDEIRFLELKAKVDKMEYLVDYKSPEELNKLKKEEYDRNDGL